MNENKKEMKLLEAHKEAIEEYNLTEISIDGGYKYIFSNEKYKELQYLTKDLSENAKVIDIGVGMGVATRTLAKLDFYTIAIDNPKTGRNGKDIEILNEIVDETISIDVSCNNLPFADNSIDAILFSDVIEHLIHSPKNILNEIHRVLKPEGVCVITTPNALRVTVRIKVLLGFSNWPNIKDYYYSDFHGGHHHEYTKKELLFIFEEAKLKVEKFESYGSMKNVNIESLDDLHSRSRAGPLGSKKSNILFKIGSYILSIFEYFSSMSPQFIIVVKK